VGNEKGAKGRVGVEVEYEGKVNKGRVGRMGNEEGAKGWGVEVEKGRRLK